MVKVKYKRVSILACVLSLSLTRCVLCGTGFDGKNYCILLYSVSCLLVHPLACDLEINLTTPVLKVVSIPTMHQKNRRGERSYYGAYTGVCF